ncbi:MAG: hypothetical protein HYT28_02240 [Parcubacteria group bacterium]|nr:hypothetical protein [Parcubacteria group bacterium]
MEKYSDADNSKYGGDSSSKVAKAGHDFRDDATDAGIFERGNSEKNSQRFSKDDKSGKEATGFWKSIFG